VLPMAVIGWFISLFHYFEQKIRGFAKIKPCAGEVPCNGEYINSLGFITNPFLALGAYSFIIILMFFLPSAKNKRTNKSCGSMTIRLFFISLVPLTILR